MRTHGFALRRLPLGLCDSASGCRRPPHLVHRAARNGNACNGRADASTGSVCWAACRDASVNANTGAHLRRPSGRLPSADLRPCSGA